MLTNQRKSEHEVLGVINEEGTDIVGYVHERHGVGECPWCDFIRVENIVDEFNRRLEVCGQRIKALNMWSLGTSLKDTPSNRRVLLGWWRVFTRRVNRNEDWVPVFRVVEVGRRGFLHIHCICIRYIAHAVVLETWRSITGENSNVHVSGSARGRDFTHLIRYLVKYLTKQSSAYRWMGPLYGLGSRSRAVSTSGGPKGIIGGSTCYRFKTPSYVDPPDPQDKL